MNNDFNESIVMLDDKSAVHNFWYEKIKEILRDRVKSIEYDMEIEKLVPLVSPILKRYPVEHHRMNRVINLESRWDSTDGNPIFYGYLPYLRKAIRIIQSPPIDDTNQLSAWVEKSFTNFKGGMNAEKTDELVIYVELNPTTYHYAMLFIYFWVTRRAVRESIQEFLIQRIYDTKIRGEHSLD
ncbi:Uncharacterised protein [Klebsiella variicola]|uniref:hypothetical protein n=1 Tax=Klebsiella variicola TaxID=244366 RepID=UPI000E2B1F06|nr:hypothetical protein [Klebsiella variicola]SXF96376.1 Uncharacterised protein [Klebsiella variicola]